MVIDKYSTEGKVVGQVELDDRVFNVKINDVLIYKLIKTANANLRQGTASTKERSLIRGGGAKPWRQKGTGRARAGTSRSPIWTGGGTVFGPHPRSYAFSLPKKVRKSAIRMVLTSKLREDKLTVLDKIDIEAPKTKLFAEMMKNLGVQDQKTLFLIPEKNSDLTRASRNLFKTLVLPSEGINVYDLLRFERLTILKDALPKISERLS